MAFTHIKIRRDTAANWTSVNPVLEIGEPGLETDTRKVKYGDGTTAWTLLPYGSDSGFDGQYSSLTGKPTLFSGAYDDLTGKPTLFSGAYDDLTGKPTLFSGAYDDLTGKPALFSGAYNDLTGKPTIPTKVSDLTNDNANLVNGSYTVNLDSTGRLNAKMFIANEGSAGSSGYSFGNLEGGNDSGMFSSADGVVKLVSDTQEVANFSTSGFNLKKKLVFNDSTEQTTAWTGSIDYTTSAITNKPTIPAAQIQSDWAQNDNTQVDYIKHKPTFENFVEKVAVPASASADGLPGQIAFDSGNLYVCVALNTWVRTTLSTWT